MSRNEEMNYIFARIYPENIIRKELFKNGLYVTIFKISDSKVTPENFSEGDEFLQSYMISVTPDGDYYTNSKLYKIEGLCNPKILEIKETTFPKFLIKVEHGLFNDRKTKLFELEGVE
tara:strand:- start:5698 stop:6051 length:354 start_codon:yes stop_codon:yes gene_type:complete